VGIKFGVVVVAVVVLIGLGSLGDMMLSNSVDLYLYERVRFW